jgi:crotonobetainyl-CoA:carnitine CoA-transferase CaiB-like acyl-CoA transferase
MMNGSNGSQPLAGIRVLDFGHIVAAPFCTRILADLGADVVKIETSLRKDFAGGTRIQGIDLDPDERPPAYHNINRNKRSVAINLKSDAGRALAARMAAVADVVVENFSAGVMERLGLGFRDLKIQNPRLIFVSMSGYGHSGPRRDWRSMNLNLQAYSGLMTATGSNGDPPVAISNSWNDFVGGLHACFGILQALLDRNRTGSGTYLDLSQFECSVASIGALLLAASFNRENPSRIGNGSTSAVPHGCYRCAGEEKYCVIAVESNEQWSALVNAMGNPCWASDIRFQSLLGRMQRREEIDAQLEQWTSMRQNTEVERLLKSVGVPAERVRQTDEIVESVDDQSIFTQVNHPSQSPRLVATVPFVFSNHSFSSLTPAPRLGEDNRYVLHHWMRLSDAEITELESLGALK